jgi:hypothetical protein
MKHKVRFLLGSILSMVTLITAQSSYASSTGNNLKNVKASSNLIVQQAEIVNGRYIYRVLDGQRACVDLYAGKQIGANYITDAWHSPQQNNHNICKVRFTTQVSYQQNSTLGANLGAVNGSVNNTMTKNGNMPSRIGKISIPRGQACSQQQGTARSVIRDGYIYCVHNR